MMSREFNIDYKTREPYTITTRAQEVVAHEMHAIVELQRLLYVDGALKNGDKPIIRIKGPSKDGNFMAYSVDGGFVMGKPNALLGQLTLHGRMKLLNPPGSATFKAEVAAAKAAG